MAPRQRQILIAAATAATLALVPLTLIDITRGEWDHDSGYYLLRASQVADGLKPYLDYESIYPPLLDALHGLAVASGIDRLTLTIAIPLAWIAAISLASGWVAFRLTLSLPMAIVAAAGYPLYSVENGGNHVTLEHGVVFFTLAAVAFALRSPARKRDLFFAGMCAAAAFLSKQNGALVALLLLALIGGREARPSFREVAAFTLGVFVVPIALLCWLDFRLHDIYANTVVLLGRYASASESGIGSFWREFDRSAPTALLLCTGVIAALAGAWKGPRPWLALASLVGGVAQFLPRFARNYAHYNLNIWPFVLIALLLASNSSRIRIARAARFVIALLSVLWISAIAVTSPRWRNGSDLLDVFAPAAAYARTNTTPDEPLREYGAEPIINFLADRRPVEINNPPFLLRQWDGSHHLHRTPTRIAVVVDFGQPWVPSLTHSLIMNDYALEHQSRSSKVSVSVYRGRNVS